MISSARTLSVSMFLACAVMACRSAAPVIPAVVPPPAIPAPSVSSQWMSMQSTVLALVTENRASAADSSLSQFARENARTPEGDRARWWRTLMRAEARMTGGDATVAIAHLDTLLADSIAIEVRAEAVLLRRTVIAVDSARRAEVRKRVQATQLSTDRQDELKVARDSMAKLTAEVERLRRRLRSN
jgi:hypothetical protein